MTRKDLETAIRKEVENWPGVTVEFVDGGKHPKAKLTYTPAEGDALNLSRPYAGTPSDAAHGIHRTLGDMRRVMKQLGATRATPAPSKEEDEAPYRKPNDGREKRPDPVEGEPPAPKKDAVDQLVDAGAVTPEAGEAVRASLDDTIADNRSKARAIIGQSEAEASRVARDVILAEAKALVASITDGVYFDLADDVYHAVPRLSASGIQKICVSPGTFWRNSWLDPERPELDEEQTLAQMLGKAYHKARLEPELFPQTYFRGLDKSEFPDALFTADQMKAVCEDIGLSKTGTKDVLADRLVDHGYSERPIWTVMERQWEIDRAGRIPLPAKHYDQMTIDMDRIHQNGEVAELLTGGFAEVSIFWTDKHGIKMKSRVDYLAAKHWADFKTFDNSRGKQLDECLADAFRYNRYYVQGTVYREAVEAIRTGGLDIIGDATDEQRAFIAAMRINPVELDCHYVFQEKGGIPNLIAYEFPFYMVPFTTIFHEALTDDEERKQAVRELTRNRTRLFMKGQHEVIEAKKLFMLYSQIYPPGTPWFPIHARRTFTDEQFSAYWLEP
jgi:hypothetical protein